MPYDIAHNKLTVLGDCYGGAETWQWSLRYLPSEPATDATLLADATEWLGLMEQFYATGTGNQFSDSHRLLAVKAARIGVNGRYPEDQDAQLAELETPQPGGNSTNALPQLAMVVTTETGASRGLAHRGRFYLAGMVASVNDQGVMGDGVREPILAGLVFAMNAMGDNEATSPVEWIVASNTRTGAHRPITRLSMDRVYDTHQSRRRQLESDRLYSATVL